MIIWIYAERLFDRVQCPFLIKALRHSENMSFLTCLSMAVVNSLAKSNLRRKVFILLTGFRPSSRETRETLKAGD